MRCPPFVSTLTPRVDRDAPNESGRQVGAFANSHIVSVKHPAALHDTLASLI
jgi:hypothetical protein